jgi:acyl dehydratase
MSVHRMPEPDGNARLEPFVSGPGFNAVTIKRDFVKPVPEGTYVAMVFEVVGYDQDCDGSAMARFRAVNRHGEPTGWEPSHLGLYADTDVVLDAPGDLHDLIEDA